ncbi:hypothetical protein DBV15_07242 [Temnothorax longispinosus]|uniref:Uncharacterized protein n=1 Tax=Temnothorax longispinosus TaxID=300112 RepID=A0A4V3S757_9HYME|nr:hypothetical protein DBV15_07242 [Temnothorax longispinosus]
MRDVCCLLRFPPYLWSVPFRSCKRRGTTRNRGEETVHGPKAKQLIANRHEYTPERSATETSP